MFEKTCLVVCLLLRICGHALAAADEDSVTVTTSELVTKPCTDNNVTATQHLIDLTSTNIDKPQIGKTLACDGEIETYYQSDPDKSQPFLTIHLDNTYRIKTVTLITNIHAGCSSSSGMCSTQLAGAKVEVLSDDEVVKKCGEIEVADNTFTKSSVGIESYSVGCIGDDGTEPVGNAVRVRQEDTGKSLLIAEISVHGYFINSIRSDQEAKKWRNDGRCGAEFPLPDGAPGQCNPDAPDGNVCCSSWGWCGKSEDHCCDSCINYSRKLTLRVNCDNHLELYLDGVKQEDGALNNWSAESTFETSDKLGVIAMKCTNNGGPGGIIGSLHDETGNVVFYTDTNWKCSSVFEEDWQLSQFQASSENWQKAVKKGDHSKNRWGYIGDISHDADWIWAVGNKRVVYCRGIVPVRALIAKHSEALKDTEAKISCVATGLTKKLDTVEWQKPNSGVKITDDTDGYKIDEGQYDEASHTQTTVLTIPKSKNIADSAYTCIVHSNEHDKSEEKKVVNSNVFTITPVDLDATTSVAQTLTCNIGHITTAVDVKWKVKDGGDITNTQEGYTITKGSVNQNDVQESTLTISAAQLQKLDTSSPVTYQCSAKSSQYPQSKESPYQNLVVTFHYFGLIAKHSEALKGTEAKISCVATGLTKILDTVKWEKPNSGGITEGYKINQGQYDEDSHTQTAVLTIPKSQNIADSAYTCIVHSSEHKSQKKRKRSNQRFSQ